MDEFLLSVATDIYPFLLILVSALALYYWGGRRSSFGLMDPWMVQQVLTACASSAVFFLWWIGQITAGIAAYHAAATILFYAIASYRPPSARAGDKRARRKPWRFKPSQAARMQISVFAVLVIAQIILWSFTGLPVLLPSRLDAAATGGGIGFLTRIISVLTTVTIFLTVVRIGQRNDRYSYRRDVSVLLTLLLVQIANGSKTNIVFTFFFIFACDWLCASLAFGHRKLVVSRRVLTAVIVAVFSSALLPFVLESLLYPSALSENALLQFALRVVLSGDSYIYFYGDNYLSQVARTSPTLLLAGDLLGTLRLVSRDALPPHPGFLLYQDLFPFSDSIKGPNLRFDLFGLMYGGALQGLIVAALCAVVFNWMRSAVFRARSMATILVAVHLFLNAPVIVIDPTLASVLLFNAALCWPLLLALDRLTRSHRGRRPVIESGRIEITPAHP